MTPNKERDWEEIKKMIDKKSFRYGNKGTTGTKHGLNISDVKIIIKSLLASHEAKVKEDLKQFIIKNTVFGSTENELCGVVKATDLISLLAQSSQEGIKTRGRVMGESGGIGRRQQHSGGNALGRNINTHQTTKN